jgi:hypothetical protein
MQVLTKGRQYWPVGSLLHLTQKIKNNISSGECEVNKDREIGLIIYNKLKLIFWGGTY